MERDRGGKSEKERKRLTPERILRNSAKKFAALRKEAENAVSVKRDTRLYEEKLRESGREVASLYNKIQEAVAKGQTFPEDAMFIVEFFSNEAQRYLDTDYHCLSLFLIPKGTKIGEPNMLERLINRLYPHKNKSSK